VNMGQLAKAVSDLNKALELNPKSAYAFAVRGLAYLRLDKIDLAKRDAERALKLDPDENSRTMAQTILTELSAGHSGPSLVEVPVNRDGHIYVQVRFSANGRPHRFMLDTGATNTLIGKDLLEEISQRTEVRSIGKATVNVADGSTHSVTRYRVRNVYLFNLPLGEIEVMAFDRKVDNIINLLGVRSMKNLSVSIDTGSGKVEIRRKENIPNQ
jgi:tetratricopeptide (TPR) repeat protein